MLALLIGTLIYNANSFSTKHRRSEGSLFMSLDSEEVKSRKVFDKFDKQKGKIIEVTEKSASALSFGDEPMYSLSYDPLEVF